VDRRRPHSALSALSAQIIACRRCPRLCAHLREVGARKKREFASWDYWARPLPGFGDPDARLLVVGLAPAAHGGARTGRMFTGDSSGNFLARALWRAGFASQPISVTRDDGLALRDAYITAAARCAPPDNKPLPEELARCRPYLLHELALLARVRVIVALGKIAWDATLRAAREAGWHLPARRPEFAHAAEVDLARPSRARVLLVGSYHPSRQNTNTRRLTEIMFDRVFTRARAAAAD